MKLLDSDFTRVIVTHGPDGSVSYKLIDSVNGATDTASIGPIWTP